MKYTTSIVEGKLVDYLTFPYLSFEKEGIDESDEAIIALIDKGYIDLILDLDEKLMPYKDRIRKYYYKTFSLAKFFIKCLNFRNIDSVDTYIHKIKHLSKEDLLEIGITFLTTSEHDALTENRPQPPYRFESLLPLIQNFDEEEQVKWMLTQFFLDPIKMVSEWLTLLESLKPHFESYYHYFSEEIKDFQSQYIDRLNDENDDVIFEITGGRTTKTLIEYTHFLPTVTSPYELALHDYNENGFVRLGLHCEALQKQLKALDEKTAMEKITAFKNLGDKTRYDVLKCIADGVVSTKKIALKLGVSSATISYHINSLVSSKLATYVRKDKKYVLAVNREWVEVCFAQIRKDFHL